MRVTVTACPDTALNVAVTVPTPAASAIFTVLTESTTDGGSSSSVIVMVCCCVPFSVPFVTPVISKITVSFASSKTSWTAVTVVVPVVWPAGMVIVEEAKV